MARILVVEPVAQPGLDVLPAAVETEVRIGLDRDQSSTTTTRHLLSVE